MTGCGGNDTTCSRRSISGRSLSTNGTRMVRPGSQRALVATEPLDDPGPGLRDDPHRLRQCDEDEQRDDTENRDGDDAISTESSDS